MTQLDILISLNNSNIDFHDQESLYGSHNFHSFPAKFPPQLPKKFIIELTEPGDVVLDPMNGSGTTTLEACLAGRKGIGLDIDPLAILISRVKITRLPQVKVYDCGLKILRNAKMRYFSKPDELQATLESRWDEKTKEFIDYWFTKDIQLELLALILEIEKVEDQALRDFYKLAFSAIVITKSGGVSLALDLAHTRPHRAKLILSKDGRVIEGDRDLTPAKYHLVKKLRSPFEEFEKRLKINVKGLINKSDHYFQPSIFYGNAQSIPIASSSIDLVITSPPCASNAIDYMRAHKFSLVWLGYKISDLSQKRGKYIGSEGIGSLPLNGLPAFTSKLVKEIFGIDRSKGNAIHRYYNEMAITLKEIYRVLKPGKTAVVVVGSSIMRGRDTETHRCLIDIGEAVGFKVPYLGVRELDRDRRMMPASTIRNSESQIQQRMHEEYVIGFWKPTS